MGPQPSTQYHHYIPQFMLRRFAIAPRAGYSDDEQQHRKKKQKKDKHYKKKKGNEMVKAVDMDKNPPEISTIAVRRTFGIQDMYKDDSQFGPKEQMRIEQKFSNIERAASAVISRVVDAHRTNKDKISLSHSDKNLLHKFFFIMKYRSPIIFRRFNHQTAEGYKSDDRVEFLKYMQAKGFRRPLDVWFHNLSEILDIPMDSAGSWVMALVDRIYPVDTLWIFQIVHWMHLVFVTPSDPSEEFLLTENAFSIYEGPVSCSVNPSTNERTLLSYTEFHLIHIVSPHLAMILRDNSLPEPTEDMIEEVRAQKRLMLAEQAQRHLDPDHATSLLHDLPVAKARNSYTTVKNGNPVLAEVSDGKPSAADMFEFIFFRLGSNHVQTINAVMLNQAHMVSTLVFKSETALRKALEFYLSYPTQAKGEHSLKTISDRHDDPMLHLFRKLEHLAHSLGSDVKAKYHIDALDNDEPPSIQEATTYVLRTAQPILPNNPVALPMHVMVEILAISQLSIKTVHALDLILEDDRRLSCPDIIFSAVQQAGPLYFNEYTKTLPDVDLRVWKLGWDSLVKHALKVSEKDISHEIGLMQGILAQFGLSPSKIPLSAPACKQSEYASRAEQVDITTRQRNQPRNIIDENESIQPLGFLKPGLRSMLEDIGRLIQEDAIRSSRSAVNIEECSKHDDSISQTKREAVTDQTSHSIRPMDNKLGGRHIPPRSAEACDSRVPGTSLPLRDLFLYFLFFKFLDFLYWSYFDG